MNHEYVYPGYFWRVDGNRRYDWKNPEKDNENPFLVLDNISVKIWIKVKCNFNDQKNAVKKRMEKYRTF